MQRALARCEDLRASHRRLMAWRDPPAWVLGNRALALERVGRWDDALAAYAETLRVSDQTKHAQGSRCGLVGQASVLASSGRRRCPAQAKRRTRPPSAPPG